MQTGSRVQLVDECHDLPGCASIMRLCGAVERGGERRGKREGERKRTASKVRTILTILDETEDEEW